MFNRWSTTSVFWSLFLLVSAGEARTYPRGQYDSDPEAKAELLFEPIEEVEMSRPDPDINLGDHLPNPLEEMNYLDYNIIGVVNILAQTINDNVVEPEQSLRIYQRGQGLIFYWNVSTGRNDGTPRGYYRPYGFSSDHRSSRYNNAPMPWAVFFNGNIAVHGTVKSNYDELGRPASHGCVRLEQTRARTLFHLIGHSGYGDAVQIDRQGQMVKSSSGLPVLAKGIKSLIIVK